MSRVLLLVTLAACAARGKEHDRGRSIDDPGPETRPAPDAYHAIDGKLSEIALLLRTGVKEDPRDPDGTISLLEADGRALADIEELRPGKHDLVFDFQDISTIPFKMEVKAGRVFAPHLAVTWFDRDPGKTGYQMKSELKTTLEDVTDTPRGKDALRKARARREKK